MTNDAAALCDLREGDWRRSDLRGFDFGRPLWRKALGIGSGCVVPGPVLLLGRRELRDDLLLGMLARYAGGVVLVETGRLADRLARGPIYRFQPGAARSVALDPLAAIRDGEMAWRDLMVLATELAGDDGDAVSESVAAILADHLIGAEPEHRTLVMLRRRLFDADGVLRGLMAGFEGPRSDRLAPVLAEMFRVRQSWAAFPERAQAAVARLSAVLAGLADGRLAGVLRRRDVDPADLVRDAGRSTLVIAPLAGVASGPLLSAIVGQALDAIISERIATATSRRVALVFADAGAFPAPVLLRQTWREAQDLGVDLLVAATSIAEARAFVGVAEWADISARGAVFETMLLAGPCADGDASALSDRAGRTRGRIWSSEHRRFSLRWGDTPRASADRLLKAGQRTIWSLQENRAARRLRMDRAPDGGGAIAAPPSSALQPPWTEPPQQRRTPAAPVTAPPPTPPPPLPRAPIDVREALKAKGTPRRRPSI